MNKLLRYCKEKEIALTKEQNSTEIRFNIRRVYSVYPTQIGIMFYINTNKGDFFLHLYKTGGFKTEDGYDGGDLSAYAREKGYSY